MKNAIKFIAVAALALSAGGCPMGSAKVFAQTQTGGTLILEGDEGKALEDANKKMALHCGVANFSVVNRETVVVGHETYQDSVAQQAAQVDSQQVGVASTSGQTTSDSASQGSSAAVVGSTGNAVYGAEGHQDSSSTVTTNDQTTVAAGAQSTQAQGVQTQSAVQGDRQVRELRLTYLCGGGAAAPAAAAAPAM